MSAKSKTPRVDVGLVDDVDVAIVTHYETSDFAWRVVYHPDEAEKHARLVLDAVKLARKNRKEKAS